MPAPIRFWASGGSRRPPASRFPPLLSGRKRDPPDSVIQTLGLRRRAAAAQAASGSVAALQAHAASLSQARGAFPKWRRKAWQSETESE